MMLLFQLMSTEKKSNLKMIIMIMIMRQCRILLIA